MSSSAATSGLSSALLTLVVGFGVAAAAAVAIAAAQNVFGLIPSGFELSSASTALGGLTKVSHETIVVALVAGAAGMLALETRASAAVGVGVSVTTIPAAAYLGGGRRSRRDRHSLRRPRSAEHQHLLMMVVGASGVLIIQRAVKQRAAERRKEG